MRRRSSFVCVGTPSAPNGSLDTAYLEARDNQIGEALRAKNDYHSVVYRSTMLPGTMEKHRASPRWSAPPANSAGVDFGVGYYPGVPAREHRHPGLR